MRIRAGSVPTFGLMATLLAISAVVAVPEASGAVSPAASSAVSPAASSAVTPAASSAVVTSEDLEDLGFVRAPGPVVIETTGDLDPDDPAVISRVDDVRATTRAKENALVWGARQGLDVPVERAGLNGGLVVSFDTAVPSNVRTVVASAVGQWDAALSTSVPVTIRVFWECFNSPGLLGFAGPTDIYQRADLPTPSIYPASLAHTLAGSDLNGSRSEIEVALNAELAATNNCAFATDDWHISTSTGLGAGQIDLYSVVLHEVGHGLGFLGSAWDNDGDGGNPATLGFPRYAYDEFVYSGASRLLNMSNPNSQLTNGNLFFDLGGGRLYRLYAPSVFRNGSSFSHFDPSLGSTDPGVLMTPALGSGDVHRVLDAPVLSVLAQQGWDVVPRAVSPLLTSVTPGPASVTAVWDPNLSAFGTAPLQYVVTATRGGTIEATKTVSGGQTQTTLNQLLNGSTYTISVVPVDDRGQATATQQSVTLLGLPNRPTLVRSTGIGRARTIEWNAPAPSGSGPLTYQVESRVIGSPAWSVVGTTSGTAIVTTALPPTTHQFRVRASNVSGASGYSYSTIIGPSDTAVRPMSLDGQVSRLYSAYFLRPPDQAGYDFWTAQRAGGRSLASISAAFEASPEFQNRYGALTNSQFVDLVYQNVQGRPPDTAGRTFWVDYLNQGRSRGALMIGFSESSEYITRTATTPPTPTNQDKVLRLYLAFFQREPDAAGLAYWSGQLDKGVSIAAIANGFVSSAEFQGEYGSLPNDRFVTLVYQNVLIRNPDAAGLSFWLGRLSSGTSKGAMMTGFTESAEFIQRTGTLP